jgi:hypothetical protein
MNKLCLGSFLGLTLLGGPACAATFTDVGTNLVGLSQGWMAWGDCNNDGRLDLIAAGADPSWNNQTLLYTNAGNGAFYPTPTPLPPVYYTPVNWGDYDNDGFLDVLLAGGLYHNDGHGALRLTVALPDVNGAPTTWGDFNNDGRLDVVATDLDGRSMVYWNASTNFVASGQSFFPNLNPYSSLSVGDFDNDGWLDLFLCDAFGTYLFRNVGNGSFAYLGSILPGIKVGNAPLADLDGDGKVDLFLNGQGQATLYRNTGTNSFISGGNLFSGLWSSFAAWGDYDGDGRADLWVSGSPTDSPTVTRLFHNTSGGLVNSGIGFPAMYWPAVAWGDFNNDGTLDVACSGWGASGPETHIYRNDGIPSNAPPAAPVGLTAIQSNELLTLSWQAAFDPNQTNSLTYNVRIGTTPGGIDVLGPMANPATGWRLLPQRGNAGERLFACFYLPPGTNYYWSVQAIDNGFAGGPFALEASFQMDTAPAISAIPDQVIQFSTSIPPLPFIIGDFETPPDQLLLSASSSNTNLLPLDRIALDRAGSNCTVTLNPTPLNVGTSLVSVVVADPQGRNASSSFVLSVTNTAPTISHSSDIRVRPGSPVPPVAFVIGDTETPASQLTLTYHFSNTNLLQSWLATGTDSNRVLTLSLKPDQRGSCLISVVVRDPVGAGVTNAFRLEVADFDPQTSHLPNIDQGGVEWGDFDNDRKPDVLIWGYLPGVGPICRIYRNDGTNGFADIAAGLPGVSAGIARWGDFNNDGYLDVLVADGISRGVYSNTHAGAFTNIGATFAAGRSLTGGWADYDNDGRLDILLSTSSGTKLYHNNGNSTFSDSGVSLPPTINGAAAWGDYDGDGDLDLALSGMVALQGKEGSGSTIFRNDGNGIFIDIRAGLQPVSQGSLAWGDLDQDGRLDLLLTGINGNYYYTRLYRNNGDDTFSVVATNLVDVHVGAGVWGDFDNDGLPDIFLTGLTAGQVGGITALLYRNNGDGTVANLSQPLIGTYWSGAAWGDFDGDGALDILYCGTTNGLTSGAGTLLYRNVASIRSNTPPTAPSGLTLLPNQVLSWNAGSDRETTNPGLTYNLRIGTTPGGSDVLAPDADPASGQRRLARFGNIGPAARWRASLPYGTYYWSVQTIDTAFASSPFAPEASFVVNKLRPVISAVTNRIISYNTSSPPIPVFISDFETNADALLLTGSSANTNLVALEGLVFEGTGSNRTLVVTPAIDRVGTAKITLSVAEPAGLSSETAFVLTVTNYSPRISKIPDQHAGLAQTTPPIPFTVSDTETPAAALTLAADSSNTNLLPVANIVFGGSGSNRTATLTPVGPNPGTAIITVTVTDGFGARASTNFLLSVERFSLAATNLAAASRGKLAWGDFDNDGWLDLAIAGAQTSILDAQGIVYRNVAGTFVRAVTLGGNWVDSAVTWADYNGDGWLDLGYMGRNSGIDLYPNNQAGGFGVFMGGHLVHSGAMAWGDADNDGIPDLLAAGATGVGGVTFAELMRNDHSPYWTWFTAATFTPVAGASVTFADFDKDGDLDILLSGLPVGATNGITVLYRNDGTMKFSALPPAFPGLYNSAAAWADYDNDGWPDLAICGKTGTTNLTLLFHNNHDGSFTSVNTGLPGVQSGSIAWGDYDNDGFPDLLLTGTTDGAITCIFRNNHDGTFTDLQAGLPGVSTGHAAWGDYDNDGNLDIALEGAGGSTSFTRIYRNSTLTTHTLPAPPPGLSAVLSNGVVTFAWSPPPGHMPGWSYNLRVGLSPGGNEICPSQSAPNGWRRLPEPGNCGQLQWHSLLNLAPGTYSWSVQAVDAALAGSAFAPEQSFTFTNFPATGLFSASMAEDGSLFALPASPTNASGQTFSFTILTAPSHGTVVIGPDGQFTYRPDTNFFGNDAFVFQASAGGSNLPPGIVVVSVAPLPDAAQVVLAIRPLADGNLELRLTGEPYQNYEFQQSVDLALWSGLAWTQASGSGTLLLTNSRALSRQFFRARAVDSIPPQLSAPTLTPNRQFTLTLRNLTPGRTNILQVSPDLINWYGVSTNLALSNSLLVADPDPAAPPRRYYRASEFR